MRLLVTVLVENFGGILEEAVKDLDVVIESLNFDPLTPHRVRVLYPSIAIEHYDENARVSVSG